jgi:hypothetical protein
MLREISQSVERKDALLVKLASAVSSRRRDRILEPP